MKVLVTSRLYPSSAAPSRGTFVHEQARFVSAYCDLEIISPTPLSLPLPGFGRWSAYGKIGRIERRDGLAVRYPRYLSLPRRLLFSRAWRFYLSALKRANKFQPALIHAHLAYPDGLAAVEYGCELGCPVVISVHGHDVRELPEANPAWRTLITRALGQAALVIASSGDVQERVRALGVDDERIRFIPQGVDCTRFQIDNSRRAGENGWRLLYVGRFDVRKGIGVLLEAMHLVRQQREDVRLQLVGGSPVSGTDADYRQQVEELGLAGYVEFIDEKPHGEMPGIMAKADIFVLPSFYDSFGIVLVEAMACGLPVVATRCGGPQDIVEEASGRLVAVGDAEDMAAGILATLADYERYDADVIRARVEQRYDYRRVAQRIYEVYEEALAAR
ncbi:MAG: glycosyltransferase family 4 protein [Candidatus Latescibacterota bacterium]